MNSRSHDQRLHSAIEVLEGLSVGDALGEAFSYNYYSVRDRDDFSVFGDNTVHYTDDTEMACAIVETLQQRRNIDEDAIAWAFAMRYKSDPERGYGRMARHILEKIAVGASWRSVSSTAFGGGSFGNGAAMRVAPLGAYFSEDLDEVAAEAKKSALVTHAHPEGIAGAIAVAVAAACAFRERGNPPQQSVGSLWKNVIDQTPEGEVKLHLQRALEMSSASAEEVARTLGNGSNISAQDTVPFCIWNACNNLTDYREGFYSTVEVGGDCDTNAAIVGAITCAYLGRSAIPAEWLRVREKLPVTSVS